MTPIELPRALEDYFAFAETEPTGRGRRFSISLPYFNTGQRLHGEGPIPHVGAHIITTLAGSPETETETKPLAEVIPLPVDRIAASA
jgi:hypothetical protein